MLYGRYENDRFKNMEKMSIQILYLYMYLNAVYLKEMTYLMNKIFILR